MLDLAARQTKEDPLDTWQRLQRDGSVVRARLPLLGTPALATRRDTARQVLEDESRFTVDATRVGHRSRTGTVWWVPGPVRRLADNLLVHEGDEHRRRRRRVEDAFRRSALQRLQPVIEQRTEACLRTLQRSAAPCFVRDVTRPLPLRVIGELLGLDPASSAPGTPFGRALQRLSAIGGPAGLLRAMPALRRLSGALAQELDARRQDPRDDLLSELVRPLDGEAPPTQDECISMTFLLYLAGHETTTHLLSVSLLELLRSDTGLATLAPLPDARAISELVRATSPVELSKPRFVVHDTELDGHRLERGSTIAALIGAANHDDRVWTDPGRIDPTRLPARHLGFGAGTHACLGLQLALREASCVFGMLMDRMPDIALRDPGAPADWTHRTGLRALASLPLRRMDR